MWAVRAKIWVLGLFFRAGLQVVKVRMCVVGPAIVRIARGWAIAPVVGRELRYSTKNGVQTNAKWLVCCILPGTSSGWSRYLVRRRAVSIHDTVYVLPVVGFRLDEEVNSVNVARVG